jgi:nicotinate-nucleotide pyrophosphorylase (carboxylating)
VAHARTCIVLTSHHNRDLTWRDLIEEPNSSKNMPKTIPASELLLTVRTALQEDMGSGDLTAMLVSADHSAVATVTSREAAILCGIPWFEECFRELDSAVEFRWLAHEGERLEPAQTVCEIQGNARALLSAERTALNFLQTLSATATATRQYVDAVADTSTLIYDTRKTLPCLRIAQKYAVRVGGGTNHRMGLYAGVLIKENHIAAAGGIPEVLRAAAALVPLDLPVQIEVETCDELRTAIAAGAKLILLDNFTIEQMREAVAITAGCAELEASGGITLANLREVAETGVSRISIGCITKNIKAIDLSMCVVC